jgi:hypothetical protein
VQLKHLSFEALEKEELISKLFDLLEPEKKAKYVFIPSSAIAHGKKFPIGTAVCFFEKRSLIVDHLEFLQEKGLKVNIQSSNRAEAMKFKSEGENRTEKKAYNQDTIGNKSPPNEENGNEIRQGTYKSFISHDNNSAE